MSEENNVMHHSAFIKPGYIKIKGKRLPYGGQIQEQDEYSLGELEKGYTLEKLCKDIIKSKKYYFSKEKKQGKKPPRILQINYEGKLLVCFSLRDIAYRSFSCYKMSNDKKVLYEYDKDKKSVVSATYYDDNDNVYVYFTDNRERIENLLRKHEANFNDDVSIDDKNNILNEINNNNIPNQQNQFVNMNESSNLFGQNNNNPINQDNNNQYNMSEYNLADFDVDFMAEPLNENLNEEKEKKSSLNINNQDQQNQSSNMNESNNFFRQNNNNQINQDKNNNSKNDKFNNNEIIFNKNLNKDLQLNKCIVTNVNSDKKVNSDEKFNRKSDNNNNQNQFPENINTKLTYGQQVKPSNNSDRCWNNLKWLDCCGLCRDK